MRLDMMYKFVQTLDDSSAWVKHFEKQVGATAPWKSSASGAVVILHEAADREGVDDPRNLHTVSPIEQVTQQATAALSKDIKKTAKKGAKVAPKRKAATPKVAKANIVKNTVNVLKGRHKDIFAKDIEINRQKDSINSAV